MIFYITLIFSFMFCQVRPYEEPIFIKNPRLNHINTLENNNKLNIIIDENVKQYKIEMTKNDLYQIKIGIESSNNFKIYIINEDNNAFIGPYQNQDIINSLITCNPMMVKNLIIEINTSILENKNLNLEITIDRFIHSNIFNNIQTYSSRENPIILVTGYWPPTNEMIRHFSQDPTLNPSGWMGDNWEGNGYDIISYFPTFDNPDCSNCGQGNGILQVDYQNTSNDFWPIVEEHKPIAIITFSRGYIDQSWELENNYYNRTNWYNDYSSPFLPTPNPPDTEEESFYLRNSTLPMNEIIENIDNLQIGLNSYIDVDGDPGHFVSEFMGYHGVWYRDLNLNGEFKCLSAGHVHVGGQIDTQTARIAADETIRTLTNYLDQFLFISGDANLDDIIDVLDLVVIMNHILGNTELSNIAFFASDINEDGIINIQDIILLINIILNN